jgi:hypothetical protein
MFTRSNGSEFCRRISKPVVVLEMKKRGPNLWKRGFPPFAYWTRGWRGSGRRKDFPSTVASANLVPQ